MDCAAEAGRIAWVRARRTPAPSRRLWPKQMVGRERRPFAARPYRTGGADDHATKTDAQRAADPGLDQALQPGAIAWRGRSGTPAATTSTSGAKSGDPQTAIPAGGEPHHGRLQGWWAGTDRLVSPGFVAGHHIDHRAGLAKRAVGGGDHVFDLIGQQRGGVHIAGARGATEQSHLSACPESFGCHQPDQIDRQTFSHQQQVVSPRRQAERRSDRSIKLRAVARSRPGQPVDRTSVRAKVKRHIAGRPVDVMHSDRAQERHAQGGRATEVDVLPGPQRSRQRPGSPPLQRVTGRSLLDGKEFGVRRPTQP